MRTPDDGPDSINEVGEATNYDGLSRGNASTLGNTTHLRIEICRMCLMGWETGVSDIQHLGAIQSPSSPELGTCQTNTFIGVDTNLVRVGRAVFIANGFRTPGQVQNPQRRTAHTAILSERTP
tara:strand:- start:2240 stop:2608 length:369 start_codon:yes stop_codon:yes gene_type:complete